MTASSQRRLDMRHFINGLIRTCPASFWPITKSRRGTETGGAKIGLLLSGWRGRAGAKVHYPVFVPALVPSTRCAVDAAGAKAKPVKWACFSGFCGAGRSRRTVLRARQKWHRLTHRRSKKVCDYFRKAMVGYGAWVHVESRQAQDESVPTTMHHAAVPFRARRFFGPPSPGAPVVELNRCTTWDGAA